MAKCCVAGLLLTFIAGCFQPAYQGGVTACSSQRTCPSGFQCDLQQDVCIREGDVAPDTGAPIDSRCFGTFVNICFDSLPTAAISIAATDPDLIIDTASDTRCDRKVANACVIAATRFTIAATRKLRGHGTRPLILISTGSEPFQIDGEIDVSSRHQAIVEPTDIGAGALNAQTCLSLSPAPVPATGTSGGFGGSFGGRGGNGEGVEGAEGVAAGPLQFPSDLRGGCPGGDGASASSGGPGGAGGGAVLIVAKSVQLSGKINASGAGGKGGTQNKSGGGGGGSGGLIIVDAETITGTGSMFANGGGGGGGGSPSAPGDPGGESQNPLVAAIGARNSSNDGGAGGGGSSGTRVNGSATPMNAQNQGGGGGGGGGAGFIRARVVSGVSFAPPLTP